MLRTAKHLGLSVVISACVLVLAGQARSATITVNTSFDFDSCDGVVSYREAIELANDGTGSNGVARALSQAERNQISSDVTWVPAPPPSGCPLNTTYWFTAANIGDGVFDNIKFDNSVGTIVFRPAAGPLFDFRRGGDGIDGKKPDGSIVVFDGRDMGATDGVDLNNDNYLIFNLEIKNFGGDGIACNACKNSYFRGLKIHNNGRHGIHMFTTLNTIGNPQNDTIGGTGSDQGNVIFSNGMSGINITAALNYDRFNENIVILNNLIGTSDGVTAQPNNRGIELINTWGVTVGDASGLTKNIISGNAVDGITISGSGAVSNSIFWNNIGTDINGNTRLGNGASGVAFLADAGDGADLVNSFQNRVGKPGFPNLISANGTGVFIADTNTSNNIVQSNLIGTGNGGNNNLGNSGSGVYFANGTFDNQIGGTGANEGNLIAFNNTGIFANGGVRNAFIRNRIFSNVNLGIDLAPSGVTPNDSADVDTGPNNLQNFPVITYVNTQISSTNIQGTLNSTPNRTFTLEFFGNSARNPSNYGEGRNFLGSTSVTTNSGGNAAFNVTFSTTLSQVGTWVTATATDFQNNTSEFSLARYICADLSISPPGVLAFSNGGQTSFNVSVSAGCSYTVQSNAWWAVAGSPAGNTVNVLIYPNSGPSRNTAVNVFFNNGDLSTFIPFNISQGAGVRRSANDFDGDGKTDLSIFRPNGATGSEWWYLKSSNGGNYAAQFGTPTDKLVAADFTGDGKADIAFWRPSSGQWFILRSEDSSFYAFPFGSNGDIPVAADFDGDGKADPGIFRPSTATWYILNSAGGTTIRQFGASTDVPVTGDFDGDGKSDLAVYRRNGANGSEWWILRSGTGQVFSTQFGLPTDKAFAGDFTGDGRADMAFWRPSTGTWYILRSEDLNFYAFPFGANGDVPVPGDYDGDGKTDAAVFRPSNSTWYILRSTAGTIIQQFGAAGDVPVPSEFVRYVWPCLIYRAT